MNADNFDQLLSQVLGKEPAGEADISPLFAAAAGIQAANVRWQSERDERDRMARHSFHLRRLINRRAFGIGARRVRRVHVRPGRVWTTWRDQC